ncbi:MAG TPA: PAS domain-containing protein [Chthoniobacterales bacterium]|jgi:PAS domain S-box-containing protein|nr:PAS domain-containing protein [Chthoniobacterales bacterium]
MNDSNNDKVGILDINYDTGRAYWGPQLRDLLGVTRKVPANFHLLLKLVHPDDRRVVSSIRAQTLRQGCPARQEVEFRILDAAGEIRWLYAEVRVEFRATASQDVVRVVGVVIDVTRVHLEASVFSLARWTADHRSGDLRNRAA